MTVEIFSDGSFAGGKESRADCKLAWLGEPPSIDPGMYHMFTHDKAIIAPFDLIFTFHEKLLNISDKFSRFVEASGWVSQNNDR